MPNKYNSIATQSQKEAMFEHGPHIADLIIERMEPTRMSPTELFNRYRDERHPRPGEKFTEWALIHFGYISLKNIDNTQAAQEELIGHLLAKYEMPEFDTAAELIAFHEAHPRVDGKATDEGLLRMDLENVRVIGLGAICVDSVTSFCESMVVQPSELAAAEKWHSSIS